MGIGELLLVTVVALTALWFVAPVMGIIRASQRRARGAHSAAAPILAGVSLGLLLCSWGLRGRLLASGLAFLQLALHLYWLWSALQANRAANRTREESAHRPSR